MLPVSQWSLFRKAAAVVVAVGVGVVGYAVARNWYRGHLAEARIEVLRQAGVPTDNDELNQFVRLALGEADATKAWLKPIANRRSAVGTHPWGLRLLDEEGFVPPAPGEQWDELPAATDFVGKHASYYAQIDSALAAPGRCVYVTDHSVSAALPHIDGLGPLSRMLALRAFVRAHEGDTAGALADLRGVVDAAETLEGEPMLISPLVRARLLEHAMWYLAELLPSLGDEPDGLAALQQQLQRIDLRAGLRTGLLGYRASAIDALEQSLSGRLRGVWHEEDRLAVLNAAEMVEQRLSEPWPEPLVLAAKYEQDLHVGKVGHRTPWGKNDLPPSFGVNLVASRVVWIAEVTARLRAAAVGAGAVRLHAAEGRWPGTMDELVPKYLEQPCLDPFTGEPLLVHSDPGELRIYSVGVDRRDDGAVETLRIESEWHQTGRPDVVFEMELREE